MVRLLRFFRLVDPAPAWMSVVTCGLAVYGLAVVWMDRTAADSALAALLLWQMLSASRGFAAYAGAGHFDPVLTQERRWRVALAHLTHSIGRVVTVWTVVAIAEFAKGVPRPLALESGRLAAFAFVGACAWSLSLGTTRLVSGALWLVALAVLAVTPLGLESYASMTQKPAGPGQVLHAVLLTMICPFLMTDIALPMREQVVAGLVLGALMVTAAGVAAIVWRSYPLEPSA